MLEIQTLAQISVCDFFFSIHTITLFEVSALRLVFSEGCVFMGVGNIGGHSLNYTLEN